MSFKFNCSACRQELEAEEAWCGMELQCPYCQQKIIVPQCTSPMLRRATPEVTLYSPKAAGLWSLLFSPIFGSWCVWQNYKTIGDEKAATRSMLWVITLFILQLGLFLLQNVWFPNFKSWIVTIVALIGWYFLEERAQEKYLQNNNMTYTKKSFAKPIAAAIVIIVLLATAAKTFSDMQARIM